jgi:hypothetical protein
LKNGGTFRFLGPYPIKRSATLSLPPLSSQYTELDIRNGGALELDFTHLHSTGLSARNDIDVSLIGADYTSFDQKNGQLNPLLDTFTNNNPSFVRISPAKSLPTTTTAVCLNADDFRGTYAGWGPSLSTIYVIVDNHSMTNTVSGQWTTTLRTECAHSMSGTISDVGTGNAEGLKSRHNESATYVLGDTYYGWQPLAKSTYVVDNSYSGSNGPCTQTGSGQIHPGVLGITTPDVFLQAYITPYDVNRVPPRVAGAGWNDPIIDSCRPPPVFPFPYPWGTCRNIAPPVYKTTFLWNTDRTTLSGNCVQNSNQNEEIINDTVNFQFQGNYVANCGLWSPSPCDYKLENPS